MQSTYFTLVDIFFAYSVFFLGQNVVFSHIFFAYLAYIGAVCQALQGHVVTHSLFLVVMLM